MLLLQSSNFLCMFSILFISFHCGSTAEWLQHRHSESGCKENKHTHRKIGIINELAFVNLIPVAEQSSSPARIGPCHCGHRTGAVLCSDKKWHAVLEHRLALIVLWLKHCSQCCPCRSGVRVTVLGHCQALAYDPVTVSVKDLYQMWKIPEQCSKHFLPLLYPEYPLGQCAKHWQQCFWSKQFHIYIQFFKLCRCSSVT